MNVSGALVIGLAAGMVCFWAATWLKNKLGYDDYATLGLRVTEEAERDGLDVALHGEHVE